MSADSYNELFAGDTEVPVPQPGLITPDTADEGLIDEDAMVFTSASPLVDPFEGTEAGRDNPTRGQD